MNSYFGIAHDFRPTLGVAYWSQMSPDMAFLLFAMTPNLESAELTIAATWAMYTAFQCGTHLGRPGYVSKVTFPKLTRFHLRFSEADPSQWPEGSWTAVVGPLLTAVPNVKSLELRGFSGFVRGSLTLPPQLASLVFIDNYVSNGALRDIADTCAQISRLCTYSYHNGRGDHEVEYLTGKRLRVLAETSIASRLQTLALCITVLDRCPVTIMGRFTVLKVLGIRYAFNGNKTKGFDSYLLVNLVKDCPNLRGLLVAGAFRISQDGLKRFATAASRLEFTKLRQVKLVCRSEFWDALQRVAKDPVPALLRFGNVKLVLRIHDYEGTARLVEELEQDVL